MRVHILNGDALAFKFPIGGEIIICREAFINGPVSSLDEQFWKERASYLTHADSKEETTYFINVKEEFEKLLRLKAEEINLWFEHDLFCQVNMWFILHYLSHYKIKTPLFKVMPPADMPNTWSGFGSMQPSDLENCFSKRIQMTNDDIQLGIALWKSFTKNNFNEIKRLSERPSHCYPYLQEVCEAHAQRFPTTNGRPQNRLRQIVNTGLTDFNDIFREFSKTEGIYGFGDHQVKEMLQFL